MRRACFINNRLKARNIKMIKLLVSINSNLNVKCVSNVILVFTSSYNLTQYINISYLCSAISFRIFFFYLSDTAWHAFPFFESCNWPKSAMCFLSGKLYAILYSLKVLFNCCTRVIHRLASYSKYPGFVISYVVFSVYSFISTLDVDGCCKTSTYI